MILLKEVTELESFPMKGQNGGWAKHYIDLRNFQSTLNGWFLFNHIIIAGTCGYYFHVCLFVSILLLFAIVVLYNDTCGIYIYIKM